MQQVPRIPRRMMIAQVANEVALLLAGSGEPEGLRSLFRQVEPWLPSHLGAIHPGVVLWLKMKAAFTLGDWPSYLSSLSDFLPAGRDDIAPVWYSCVVEFLDFCQMQASPLPRYIREGILRDSAKWHAVPPVIRSCLNRWGGDALRQVAGSR